MKPSLRVSIGGVVAALGLVLMFLTSIVPFGTYALPTLAGILLVIVVIEIGYPFALSVFAATALLSMLIVTDKEAALLYTAFFGYYPVIKALIERIRSRAVQYIVKYALFNACMIAVFYLAIWVFSVPTDSFVVFGVYLPWAFLLAGNVFFLLYDICITRIVTLYLFKWHDKIGNKKL